MKRNIYLAYFLAAVKNSWFWLGVWVLYYLRFTDYSGIGLIETVGITIGTLAEIPTGAIADLVGKKKTLILAFFLEAFGSFIMSFAQNFGQIIISVVVMWAGGALYSGTLDALVFDSLKQEGKEDKYGKIIANIASISLISMAIASIFGGFMYSFSFRLPFIANSIGYLLGFIASFILIEPKIDTIKFSWRNYLLQTRQGFKQLFQPLAKLKTIRLLILGAFLTVLTEILDSVLLVEVGFSDRQMGIIFAIIYLISSATSQISPWLKSKFGYSWSINILNLFIVIALLIMPKANLFIGGSAILLIENILPIFNNLSSEMINKQTESKYRATTISTFNMLKNLPYVLTAAFIGRLMDIISARHFAFYFGLALLAVLLLQKLTLDKKKSIR
jgi:MFS family permease